MSNVIANKYGFTGIHRCKLIKNGDEIRAYIPGINSISPFDKNGNVNMTDFEKYKETYPVIQWCAYNLESIDTTNIKGPAWVMFENGDVQRPVCISYAVIGGESENGGGNGSSSNGSSGFNGAFTTVAGEGVILIQGPVNDSRNTKYSDISQVPQTITQEWSISGCLSEVQRYANQSIGSNSIVPIAKAIVNAGGAKKTYISALGIDVVAVGNAVLCATTNKFGTDGDYLWAHFTDGTECLFVRFDEKSTSAIYGPADPANEWGHWVDYENGFGNATTISILEICGMNQSGLKKTCDYIVNLGSFLNNSSLAFKSLSEIKQTVDTKISKVNNSGSDNVIEKAISAWYADCNGKSYGRGSNQYDCSSSTSHAFYKAGILSTNTYTTETAVNAYIKAGFIDVTSIVGTHSYSNLKRGDVLWSKGHMCIYLGDGNVTTSNRSSGNSTGKWYDFATKVLRYGG